MKFSRTLLAISVSFLTVLQTSVVQARNDRSDVLIGLGAILGGALGNKAGNGDIGATVVGAIIGGVLAGGLAHELDENDRREISRARGDCLDRNQRSDWQGSGGYGSIEVLQEGYHSNRPTTVCRSYESSIYSRGRSEITRGYACRDSNGNWNEVRETEITYGRPAYDPNPYLRPNQPQPDNSRPRYSQGPELNRLECAPGYNRSAMLIDTRSNMQISQYSEFQACQFAVQNRQGPLLCVQGLRFEAFVMDIRTRQSVGYLYRDLRDCINNLR